MLEFNEELHKYTLNGKELISVTTLMKKHGLSPDYSFVNEDVLSKKADRGTLIHKELEEWLISREEGLSLELDAFKGLYNRLEIKNAVPEQKVYNELVAGTVDLQCETKYGTLLADFKTTSKIHKESVRWQLSIYEYLVGKNFDKLAVIHLIDDKCDYVEVDRIEQERIEALFEAEKNGEIYSEIKGEKIAVSGSIQTRTYEAQDGTKRYVTEIVADEVEKLNWDKSGQNNTKQDIEPVEDDEDDDLPF